VGRCLREHVDHDDAGHDEGHPDDRGGIELLPEEEPADRGDERHADAAPHGVGDADGHLLEREREAEEGEAVAADDDDARDDELDTGKKLDALDDPELLDRDDPELLPLDEERDDELDTGK
jgi:hypothetical protein